jgi:FkbH-like protein
MKDYFQLLKNLKKDFSGFRTAKVAVLGDTSTQFLAQTLRAFGYEKHLDLIVLDADFNQIERQIYDPASELYEFNPDFIILYQSSHKLLGKYNKLPVGEQHSLASGELAFIENYYATISGRLNAKVIYYNYSEIDDSVFGSFANKTPSSFLFQLRRLNFDLMQFASQNAGFFLCDIAAVQNQVGKSAFFNPALYVNSEMVLNIKVLPAVASKTIDLINALLGNFKKCLIIDLDNTIWGGIIGDDGIENIQLGSLGIGKAFTEFQYWIKKLKNRGIIIAVCSKNTESTAKEPFQKHSDMVLQLDDIAVFMANWENKVDNIRQIQGILNIGFDSMVFLDDNPVERNFVREHLPEICVPELPEDPADYLEYLYTLNLFETASFSEEDFKRTSQYKMEAGRKIVQQTFVNEDDFLKSLDMISKVEPFNAFNTPRVAQLSQRSNQFNLRTVRYTEADIKYLSASENYFTFAFTLEDKFGDNGLTCAVILQMEDKDTLFIDTWFMSCRILKRGMEHFVLNTIAKFAGEKNFGYLKGEYIPTQKNEMVKNHYKDLGFEKSGNHWLLNTKVYENKKCFIRHKRDHGVTENTEKHGK